MPIEELERITGLEKNTIYNYEKNSKEYMLSTCKKIASALDFDPRLIYDDYLLFISSDYSAAITNKRNELGINKKDFAKLLGVSPCTIGSWEAGQSAPMRYMFEKINAILQLEPV